MKLSSGQLLAGGWTPATPSLSAKGEQAANLLKSTKTKSQPSGLAFVFRHLIVSIFFTIHTFFKKIGIMV